MQGPQPEEFWGEDGLRMFDTEDSILGNPQGAFDEIIKGYQKVLTLDPSP
jgi:hypothetical protein